MACLCFDGVSYGGFWRRVYDMCLEDGLHHPSTCRDSAGGEYGVGLLDSRYQVPGNVGLFLLLFRWSSA